VDNEKIETQVATVVPVDIVVPKKTGRGSGLIPIKPGEVRGSRKGIPNKMTTTVKDAIAAVADKLGGIEGLYKWVKKNKGNEYAFWTSIYPRLLPLQVNVRSEHTETKVYKTVAELRIELLGRGIPVDRVDQMVMLAIPGMVSDVRHIDRDD
jgi:hypothetical protein